jgi:hypothetical protein
VKSGLPLVAAALVATLAVVVAWGCASQSNVPLREHDWQHHEPDGGWASYVPSPSEYEADPMRAAAGPTIPTMPTTTPVNPSPTTFH